MTANHMVVRYCRLKTEKSETSLLAPGNHQIKGMTINMCNHIDMLKKVKRLQCTQKTLRNTIWTVNVKIEVTDQKEIATASHNIIQK